MQPSAPGLDVTDRAAVEGLADHAWTEFGHVDICVNNAGVFPPAWIAAEEPLPDDVLPRSARPPGNATLQSEFSVLVGSVQA